MSETQKVDNYMEFFAIKVAPDVIPMDWWKIHRHQFPGIAQLARKWLCETATSTLSERENCRENSCGALICRQRYRWHWYDCGCVSCE